MAQKPTGTTSAQGEPAGTDLIERARETTGEWHSVPGYGWALRFLPPGANHDGDLFEIRRADAEPESEYQQYLYTPSRPNLAKSPGGAVLHCDLSANELPDGAEALADAVARSLRTQPSPRSWGRFASVFERLAPDLFGLHRKLSGLERLAYSFAGSATFFVVVAMNYWANENRSERFDLIFKFGLPIYALVFAFICSRNEHRYSPVRVYLFAYMLPFIVWSLATSIPISGLFLRP